MQILQYVLVTDLYFLLKDIEHKDIDSIELLLQKTMLVEIYKCLNGIGAAYLA